MSSIPLKDPKIDRPILCFGTGRGGTTVFLRVLSEHPELAWFSNFTHRFHHRLFFPLAFLSRLNEFPILGERIPYDWRFRPKPREANKLYRAMTNGAFTRPDPLGAADADDRQKEIWRAAFRAHLRWQGKPRFVNKHTGFPRCEFFLEIFPDARFIHVLRDGRAVANSLLNVRWWDGTLENSWWWGDMNPAYREEFEASNRNPIVLAGIVWKTLMLQNQRELSKVADEQKFEVNYTDFVADPIGMMGRVRQYCGLSESKKFDRRLRAIKIHNADDKWRRDLDDGQKRMLQNTIGAELVHFGFKI
jgi:sulfotransferase family protein